MPDDAIARHALDRLCREVLEGPAPDAAFVLNRGDGGLISALDRLTAGAASTRGKGGASIAAHVEHLRYGFQLLNRWAAGEDPWNDADWTASWRVGEVSDEEWKDLRTRLAAEVRAWAAAIRQPREWDQDGWTNAMASVVHMAYHLGAIRQIQPAAAGPKAEE